MVTSEGRLPASINPLQAVRIEPRTKVNMDI